MPYNHESKGSDPIKIRQDRLHSRYIIKDQEGHYILRIHCYFKCFWITVGYMNQQLIEIQKSIIVPEDVNTLSN